jgi:hypothetical protein
VGRFEEILIDAEVRVGLHGRGNPEVWHGADVDPSEAGSGHADYGHRVIANQDFAADDIGSAAELRLPEVIRQHHDRFDDAAERGANA